MPPRPDLCPGLAQPPPGSDAALARGWTWPEARVASDLHARGSFFDSWQFASDVETLPAVRAAVRQLLASPCGLPWTTDGPQRAPGRFEVEAASRTWKAFRHRLLKSVLRDLGLMGFSVLQHPITVNPETLRHEITTIERWPLSAVRHTSYPLPDPWGEPGTYIYGYYAVVFGFGESIGDVLYPALATLRERMERLDLGGPPLPVGGVNYRYIQLPRPGETSADGQWTVIGNGDRPHETEGAVRALDVAYVAGQLAPRSRAGLLKTLGRQVPVATMSGTTPVDSPEGKAAETVVAGLGVTAAGAVLPGGVTLAGFSYTTPTAGFFVEDARLTERAIALAVLGRADSLGSESAQYEAKDGPEAEVPEDMVRDLVGAIERGIAALLNHVAELNTEMPEPIVVCGHLPNTEQAERIKAEQERDQREAAKVIAFQNALTLMRANGFQPTQDDINDLAARCGVKPPLLPAGGLPPVLVKVPAPTVPITGAAAAPLPEPPKDASAPPKIAGVASPPAEPVSPP